MTRRAGAEKGKSAVQVRTGTRPARRCTGGWLHRVSAAAMLAVMLAAVSAGCGSTPGTTPKTPVSQTAPASPTASPDFSSFAGQWYGHGRLITIRRDGTLIFII